MPLLCNVTVQAIRSVGRIRLSVQVEFTDTFVEKNKDRQCSQKAYFNESALFFARLNRAQLPEDMADQIRHAIGTVFSMSMKPLTVRDVPINGDQLSELGFNVLVTVAKNIDLIGEKVQNIQGEGLELIA